MQLLHPGVAGTMESGDIYIELEPAETGVEIELDSTVGNQFGAQIRRVIASALANCGVQNATVRAVDKGALDCTIRARVTTAALRGAECDDYDWR